MSVTLLDSYNETHHDGSSTGLSKSTLGGQVVISHGQSFTCSANTPLYSAKRYLAKTGSPTGNVTYKLYASTGSVGTTAKPTGAALATSDPLSASSLSTSFAIVELLFTGANAISLSSGTPYVLTCEYSAGSSSNYVMDAYDGSGVPSHAGNESLITGVSSSAFADVDVIFYLYGGTPSVTKTQTGIARITATATKTNTGKARITATATKTQTGKSRITATTTRTQTGKAAVLKTATKTQTGKATILLQQTRTQTGKAKIIVPSTDTFTRPSLKGVELDEASSQMITENIAGRGVVSNL